MELGRHARQAVITGALTALGQWSRHLGAAGMAAMHALPGLMAQVDQHLAQIRDAVADQRGRIHPVTLAAYADGVADAATVRGWTAAEPAAVGWHRASWPSVHLLAVCVLAAEF